METIRGKYNYLFCWIRILFTASYLLIALIALPWNIVYWFSHYELAGAIGIALAFFALALYMLFKLIRSIRTERFNLVVFEDRLLVKDVLLFKSRTYYYWEIKGVGLEEYPLKLYRFDNLVLYTSNGTKIEFPEFLFFNFGSLREALDANEWTLCP